MVKTINSVQLLGRLAGNPVSGSHSSGLKYTSFRLETENRNGSPEFHDVRVYGNFSEVCFKHLRKGNRIYLTGSLFTREKTVVIVNDLVFLDGR